MATLEQLKQQMAETLRKGREICDVALDNNRDFSANEKTLVAEYLDEAGHLREQIKKAEGEASIRRQIMDLGKGLEGFTPATTTRTIGPWAKAWQSRGQKDLLPAGSLVAPGFSQTIPAAEGKLTTFLQAIRTEKVDVDGISYLRETLRNHNAQAVADHALKPTSVYELTEVQDTLRVIATLSEAIPRRWLDDNAAIGKFLDGNLREALLLELERLCLHGLGTGAEFAGMLVVAGTQAIAWDTDALVTTRQALTLLEMVNLGQYCAWVFNPLDWQDIELLSTETGYRLSTDTAQLPVDRATRKLWGHPVSVSNGITQGTGLLFDTSSVVLYEKPPTRIDWSEGFPMYDESDNPTGKSGFEHNTVKMRAETRHCLGIYSPLGIVEVDLVAGS